MTSTEELKRLKNQSLSAEDEATVTLDQYYEAVARGRGLTPDDLLKKIGMIKDVINRHKHASENYITRLEEIADNRR